MTVAINKRTNMGAFAFLKSKTEWMEISDYYVGDVRSDKPVAVLTGATVVGNIFAPQVRVEGLLYGTAVSQSIIINADGLIWSNVYTTRLQIEEGGKIQGFVSSIDATAYDMLCAIGNPNDLPALSFSKNIPTDAPAPPTPDQLDALTRLQAEAGAALAARAELEYSFDTRLTEIVGATAARATALEKASKSTVEELMSVSQKLGETQALSQTQLEQIQRSNDELALTHKLLQEKTGEWEELTAVYTQQSADYEQLQTKKAELDIAFYAKVQEADDYAERVTNLETALQSNLQHSAEQEDSLVRWQELGETRQKRIDELESEMELTAFKLEENSRIINMIRSQRREAEDNWKNSDEELKVTVALLTALTAKHELAKKQEESDAIKLAANQDEIKALQRQLATLETAQETAVSNLKDSSQLIQELHQKQQAQNEELKKTKAALEESSLALEKFSDKQTQQLSEQTAAIMAEADKAILTLKQKLADTEKGHKAEKVELSAQTAVIMTAANKTVQALKQQQFAQAEQLSWYKVNLKAVQMELEEERQTIRELEETAVSNNASNALLAEQQQKIEQYEFALADIEEQLTTLQDNLTKKQQEIDALGEVKEALRRTRLQLKANENEIENYLAEMDRQGHHLADIQSTLIEREIQLQQMTETAQKQASFIKKMKQITTERIQKLQQQLAQK